MLIKHEEVTYNYSYDISISVSRIVPLWYYCCFEPEMVRGDVSTGSCCPPRLRWGFPATVCKLVAGENGSIG